MRVHLQNIIHREAIGEFAHNMFNGYASAFNNWLSKHYLWIALDEWMLHINIFSVSKIGYFCENLAQCNFLLAIYFFA